MVTVTFHLTDFTSPHADSIDEMVPGERMELMVVIDESWETERGTMMWLSDMKGKSIRAYADAHINLPENGRLTIVTATMSEDREILFVNAFREP